MIANIIQPYPGTGTFKDAVAQQTFLPWAACPPDTDVALDYNWPLFDGLRIAGVFSKRYGHPDGHLFRHMGALWYSRLVMALKPGTRVGPDELTGPIGAGGMGEVYRPIDTKLQHDVAIKVCRMTSPKIASWRNR